MIVSNNVAIDMDKIKETFFVECEDHISNMEVSILGLEENPGDTETMNAIFRAAHSIKGNSGCLGFDEINSFTHILETVLDKLRNDEMKVSEDIVSILLESVDCVKALVYTARNGGECKFGVNKVLDKLKGLLGPEKGPAGAEAGGGAPPSHSVSQGPTLFKVCFTPGRDTLRRGIDPVNNIIERLSEAGEILRSVVDTSELPPLKKMDPESCYLSWEILLLSRSGKDEIENVFEFVRDESRVEITQVTPLNEEVGETEGAEAWGLFDPLPMEQASVAGAEAEGPDKKLLGEILVDEKAITTGQLNEALKKQSTSPKEGVAIVRKEDATTIRVDTGKIDKLINLAGELVITQSMISQLTGKPSAEKLATLQSISEQLERNTKEIQERVMSIRMLPIGSVFGRFGRVVRDIARAKDKKITLNISGEETELDKTLVEKIADPLTHLIRNSVDHGIEQPEERLEKGKPETGCVKLNAYHGGGCVVVTVEDDGKGLDRNRILKKAVEKGLVDEAGAGALSDGQVYDLIFLPGFSTAEVVTDVSGRGVGMDVVKRNIEALGGSISVESSEGAYTKIFLKIPLTLAVIDGLIFSIGDYRFVLPIMSVLESRRPGENEVKTVEGKGEVVKFRDKYVPLVRLHQAFKIEVDEERPWRALVVVISIDGVEYGLLVDALLGEQQVVIKSMASLQGLPGVAGATILGDGSVALILDGEGIVKRFFG